MDLLAGLRCFEAVATERSFTLGAQRLQIPQPVASRRVATLESELGTPLLIRTSRQVRMSPQGEALLPLARELLTRADRITAMFLAADEEFSMAVPVMLDARSRAAIRRGIAETTDSHVRFVDAEPEDRRRALAAGTVRAALLPVAVDQADLVAPLGVAHDGTASERFWLSHLRRSRTERGLPARALHLLAEDDVPMVRDRLQAAAHAAGLRPDQMEIGQPLTDALTRVHERGDVVVATRSEALRHELAFAEVPEPALWRCHVLAGELSDDQRVKTLRRLADGLGSQLVGL